MEWDIQYIDARFLELPDFSESELCRSGGYDVAAREANRAVIELKDAIDRLAELYEETQEKADGTFQYELRQRFRDGYRIGYLDALHAMEEARALE